MVPERRCFGPLTLITRIYKVFNIPIHIWLPVSGCPDPIHRINGSEMSSRATEMQRFYNLLPIRFLQTSSDVATQDRVFPYYVPNSSIKHSKSDSKDRSQEIL
jgi:hypothetical protein